MWWTDESCDQSFGLLVVLWCLQWRQGEYFNEVSFANTLQRSQHTVYGSASAPLHTCFSQCCYLCHKPCRVPFLTSLCCLPRSCTLPATSITRTGSYGCTPDRTSFLTEQRYGSHEASKLCSILDSVKASQSHVGLQSSVTRSKLSRCQPVVLPSALQLICASLSVKS